MNETSTLEANLFRLLHKWADASSLDLLKTLASGAKNPFVFVFTHRPVEEDHPLQQLLRDLKDCRMHVTDIKVNGLSEDNVRELVSNMLEVKRADLCGALSNYLCRVTNGSESICCFCLLSIDFTRALSIISLFILDPLFVRQQIVSLFDDGLLRFDSSSQWTWDMAEIEKKCKLHGDIVSAITYKMKRLPSILQHILMVRIASRLVCCDATQSCYSKSHCFTNPLQLCACIGTRVGHDVLNVLVRVGISRDQSYNNQDIEALAKKATSVATQEGLMVQSNDVKGVDFVEFVHDSAHSAAYSLIRPEERASCHLQLGQALLKYLGSKTHLLLVATQLARGYKLIPEEERIAAAKIFLRAGYDFQTATAFLDAHFFYARGISMLRNLDWASNYWLSCDLYMKASEVAIITKAHDDVDKWLGILLLKTTVDDQFTAQCIKIKFLVSIEEMDAAFDLGLKALAGVGVKFPSHILPLHTLVSVDFTCKMTYCVDVLTT